MGTRVPKPPTTNRGVSLFALDVQGKVDWVTASSNKERIGLAWYDLFERVTRPGEGQFRKVEQKRFYGYEGISCEGAFWGAHHRNGYLFIAPGWLASAAWPAIAPVARKVSRLDLCVTARVNLPIDPVSRTFEELRNGKNKQRRYAAIQESRGGRTLYVGSRQSGQFGRLYDKGAEQGEEPGYLWRYEVEIKDKVHTLPMLKSLYERWKIDKPVATRIAGYVHQWFCTRGVSPVFRPSSSTIEYDTSVNVSSSDRKLRWLSEQVAPTVQELVRAGLGEKALLALGLEAEQLPMWDNVTILGQKVDSPDA